VVRQYPEMVSETTAQVLEPRDKKIGRTRCPGTSPKLASSVTLHRILSCKDDTHPFVFSSPTREHACGNHTVPPENMFSILLLVLSQSWLELVSGSPPVG